MSIAADHDRIGLTWQTGVWDQIAQIYLREIDRLAAPLIAHVIARAALHAGQQVLDLGTGTGGAQRLSLTDAAQPSWLAHAALPGVDRVAPFRLPGRRWDDAGVAVFQTIVSRSV